MARTTYQTYLMHSDDGESWTKLVDIKEFPDLGKTPDTIDVTTLTHNQKTYLQDILDPGQLEFNANYDLEDYKKIKELEHKTQHYAVWFGGDGAGLAATPNGNAGKYKFEGEITVWVKGGGVSAAVDMGIAIAVSTEITLDDSV